MAWIKIVPKEEATGYTKEAYERAKGPLDEIAGVFSLRPQLFQARSEFAGSLRFGSLGPFRAELISVSVSRLLDCKY